MRAQDSLQFTYELLAERLRSLWVAMQDVCAWVVAIEIVVNRFRDNAKMADTLLLIRLR